MDDRPGEEGPPAQRVRRLQLDVIRIGKPTIFRLAGVSKNAYSGHPHGVIQPLAQRRKLYMPKNGYRHGIRCPIPLGPGNYEYHVYRRCPGGQRPVNTNGHPAGWENKEFPFLSSSKPIITFHLPGYTNAASVFLAGDFDEWSPGTLQMRREGDGWTFSVHLSVGKHTYKYIVDGDWIRDPGNPLYGEYRMSLTQGIRSCGWRNNSKPLP